jgi:hypothetical protein
MRALRGNFCRGCFIPGHPLAQLLPHTSPRFIYHKPLYFIAPESDESDESEFLQGWSNLRGLALNQTGGESEHCTVSCTYIMRRMRAMRAHFCKVDSTGRTLGLAHGQSTRCTDRFQCLPFIYSKSPPFGRVPLSIQFTNIFPRSKVVGTSLRISNPKTLKLELNTSLIYTDQHRSIFCNSVFCIRKGHGKCLL